MIFSIAIASKWLLNHTACTLSFACPKQGTKIEGVVLNRACILGIVCPKQGQGFKPSAAYLYPNIGRASPPSLPPPTPG